MKKAALAAAGALAACLPRWDAGPASREPVTEEDLAVVAPEGPAKRRLRPEDVPVVDPATREVRYYSDLGPDAVDVSSYPVQQRYNYSVYARTCSRCHTLARSINAPTASREFWELYMLGMRARGRVGGSPPITRQERQAILDFLEFDSGMRKLEDRADFETLTEELKRRYHQHLEEQMDHLQKSPRPPRR